MYTIALPVDTDESRAESQAAMVLDLPQTAADVEVVLVHVFDDRQTAETTRPAQVPAGRAAIDRLQRGGVRTVQRSAHGDPADEILRVADDVEADMIVLGGRKRSPLGSALFGSVSQQVTLEATRPVVVTGDRIVGDRSTHRCDSCGEEYVAERETEITHCRRCGGTTVDNVEEEPISAP